MRSSEGRPPLEPSVRWMAAAATTPTRAPAAAPTALVAPSATRDNAARPTIHPHSRRTGLVRCGAIVITTAAPSAMRADGYVDGGSAARIDAQSDEALAT